MKITTLNDEPSSCCAGLHTGSMSTAGLLAGIRHYGPVRIHRRKYGAICGSCVTRSVLGAAAVPSCYREPKETGSLTTRSTPASGQSSSTRLPHQYNYSHATQITEQNPVRSNTSDIKLNDPTITPSRSRSKIRSKIRIRIRIRIRSWNKQRQSTPRRVRPRLSQHLP